MGCDCYLGSGIHRNLGIGCGIFFAPLSGNREIVRSNGKCLTTRRALSGTSSPILSFDVKLM